MSCPCFRRRRVPAPATVATPWRPTLLTLVLMASGTLALPALAQSTAPGANTANATNAAAKTGAPAPRAERQWQLPAQPLGNSLARIASEGGLTLSIDAELVRGLSAAPVQGRYSAEQAARIALQGSGLGLVPTASGALTLQRIAGESTAVTLSPVAVVAREERGLATEASASYASSHSSFGKGQSLRETPQSVSIVTRQRIEDQHLDSLTDVLDQTTGISWTQGSGSNSFATFTSRGFTIENIQLDGGAPVGAIAPGFSWDGTSHLDMAQFDHVEVLRGADGLFSGSGEPGGVINLVRKRALAEPQTLIALSAGSWDNYRAEADVTGPLALDGRLRGRLVASWQDRQYFYDRAESEQHTVFGLIEADLAPSTTLSLGASYQKLDEVPIGTGLPRYTNGQDIGLPRSTSFIPAWASAHKQTRQLFATLEHDFSDDWHLKVNALQLRRTYDSHGAFTAGAVEPLTGQGLRWWRGELYRFEADNVSLDATLKGDFELLGRRHSLRFGFDYQNSEGTLYDGNSLSIISIDDRGIDLQAPRFPDPVLPVPSVRDGELYDPMDTRQHGVFGALSLQLSEPLKLILGGRYASYETEQRTSGRWGYYRKFKENDIFVPYGGVVYTLDNDWSAYASLSETYLSQARYLQGPLPGTPLDPVTGRNYEIGIKGALWDGRFTSALALYRIEREGEAVRDPDYPDSITSEVGINCCHLAQGERISQGIDVEINGQLSRGWQVFAGYTFNSNEDKQAKTGRFSTITPKHLLKVYTTYQLNGDWARWKVGGGVTAQSAQFRRGTAGTWNEDTQRFNGPAIDYAYTQPGYALWNLRAEYRIDATWSAAVNLNNVFDKTYYQTMGSSSADNFYGEPRNLTVSLRGRF